MPHARPTPTVLILNGGSSSGKSTLARLLQEVLPGYWLRFSVDTLIDAAPQKLFTGAGLSIAEGGTVTAGADFTRLEQHWMTGVAAMARAGAHVIIEDNFISGPAAQHRWTQALTGVTTGWVAVRCSADVAAAREAERGDRTVGMAAQQAESVHEGIRYDVTVNTSAQSDSALVETVLAALFPPVPA